jgi:hypothetical protein
MLIRNITNEETAALVEPRLKQLARALADQSEKFLQQQMSHREVIKATEVDTNLYHADEWRSTGAYYGKPKLRLRPFYEGRDGSKRDDTRKEEQTCNKFYETYKKQKLTGGLVLVPGAGPGILAPFPARSGRVGANRVRIPGEHVLPARPV